MPSSPDFPASTIATLDAIQTIILDARPPEPVFGYSYSLFRSEWRNAAVRRLCDFAALSDDLVVIQDGFSCLIVIGGHTFRIGAVRTRPALKHVSLREKLFSNPHKWLRPTQAALFESSPEEPATFLGFDPDGVLFIGGPDFVDERGVGWGMTTAMTPPELAAATSAAAVVPEVLPPLSIKDLPDGVAHDVVEGDE